MNLSAIKNSIIIFCEKKIQGSYILTNKIFNSVIRKTNEKYQMMISKKKNSLEFCKKKLI